MSDIPKPIRVLRVLEYRYATVDDMIKDQANWYVGLNGMVSFKHMEIRAATMPSWYYPEPLDNAEVRNEG